MPAAAVCAPEPVSHTPSAALHALLYATAATALSCHKNSKAYYRAAVALDKVLASDSSGDSSTAAGRSQASTVSRLIAAATSLMEGSVRLTGHITAAAKAQMLAALTGVAAAKAGSKGKATGRGSGSSSANRQTAGVCKSWQVRAGHRSQHGAEHRADRVGVTRWLAHQ